MRRSRDAGVARPARQSKNRPEITSAITATPAPVSTMSSTGVPPEVESRAETTAIP
jgi:hypothetical protein